MNPAPPVTKTGLCSVVSPVEASPRTEGLGLFRIRPARRRLMSVVRQAVSRLGVTLTAPLGRVNSDLARARPSPRLPRAMEGSERIRRDRAAFDAGFAYLSG